MILKTTKAEEQALIVLLQNDPIGDAQRATIKDKRRITQLCRDKSLTGLAQDLESMNIYQFEDYLTNTIYK